MRNSHFDQMILNRIHQNINIIIPIVALLSWLSAVVVYYSDIPHLFAWIDFGIGDIFFIIYLFRNKIKVETKVILIVLIPILLGITTFFDGGFSSGTMILILLGNASAMLLLKKRISIVIAALSLFSVIGLWIWCIVSGFDPMPDMTNTKWVIQIVLLTLFVFVFRISVYAIKGYLAENIESLEKSMGLTKKLAYFDTLTDLPNYNFFKLQLENFHENGSSRGDLLVLSLKNMNMINALYGIECADQMIRNTGAIIADTKEEYDCAARVSSGEFAIWMKQTVSKEEMSQKRYKILGKLQSDIQAINELFTVDFYSTYVSVDLQEGSFEDYYRKAQIALAYAKYMGKKESMVSYDEYFEQKIQRMAELKELIRKDILEESNLEMHYQPQHRLSDGMIVGVEALSRWTTKKHGKVSPAEFIPLIEDLGLHDAFGLFVMNKVLTQWPQIKKKYGDHVKVAVNISPSFLMSESFTWEVMMLLDDHQFNPKNLTLEITEEMAVVGIDKVNYKLAPLKKRGVHISLDDFGTGFSSLSYLAKLDVDEIKLDKSLIDQIKDSDKSQILIGTLISLATQYGMEIVAEGVEEQEQYDILKKLDCTIIQGYLIGKPEIL